MKKAFSKRALTGLGSGLLLAILYSCASVGTPNGGPYDEAPPKFLGSTPSPNQTNFKSKKIKLLFDELIQLEKPSENVIITPPQMELPIIRAGGKEVSIELKDSLQLNTTYTIDFTNSISDNNEKNVLENFSFAFSTGEVIDSLAVSGVLLNAENLEPMPGITVGLHSNLDDTAFVRLPFVRTSRTNDKGQFTIRNISAGSYRIFALNDVNRDYKFDQPGEDIAFCDSLIIPTFEFTSRQDTTWKDSLTIDTVRTVGYTRFMPDDITLRLFKEKFERQYMLRPERSQANKFTFRFNAVPDTIPLPILFVTEPIEEPWYFVQTEEEGKTIHFWITDPQVYERDTLSLEITYPRTDSLNILQPQTDTLFLATKRQPPAKKPKKGEEDDKPKIDFLPMTISASGSINTYDTVFVTFGEPVLEEFREKIVLSQKVDTLWNPVEFELLPDSANTLRYYLSRPWNYGEAYQLEIDSATIFSTYGKWNDKYSGTFNVKKKEDYGNLFITIAGVDTTAYVELLNSTDLPVRRSPVRDGGALFMDLKPDKYYARLVVDVNGNGKWDTGNYADKQQPEDVYYSSKLYNVMQNWDVEESIPWDVKAQPLNRQKPLEITKNKPKEATKKQRDYRNEGRQSSSRGSSGRSGSGMPF